MLVLETKRESMEQTPDKALSSFIYALKSEESQRQYPMRLKAFFNFHAIPGETVGEQALNFLEKARRQQQQQDTKWGQDCIIDFVSFHKQRVLRHELAAGTLINYYMAVKLFFEMNNLDTAINWKRIARGLPRAVKYALNDRAITVEEIRRLTEYMDPRIKALVYTMASSGIRLGAWEFLKFKHIIPMPNGNGVAKIIVYAGEPEQYFSFVTPEAFAALQEWKAYRESYGEKVTGESWVMRDLWQTSNIKRGARGGLATYPRKLKIGAIKKILNSALWQQNLRQDLPEGSKRHEFKLSHGFRKFLKTRAEGVGGMKPLNVEMILGHDSGISESYWRPTEQEVFEDYCKSVDALTINTEEVKLQRQVTKLTESAVAEAEMMRSNMKELQDKIARLEANQAEMSKLYTIESGNFRLIQDKNDPNNMIPHVYNEKSKALEPVKGEENLKKLMPWLKPNVGEENIVWLDPDSFPTEEPIKGDFITVDAYPLEYNKKRKRYELIPAAGGTVD